MLGYHALLVGLLVGTTALATGLSILNVRHGRREMRENEGWLESSLGIEDAGTVIDYERATTGLGLLQSWVLLAALLGLLYTGVLTDAVTLLVESGLHPVVQGVAFFLGLIAAQRVTSAPFDLYSTFVIDEQFDFNETTPWLWLRDFVVGLVVAAVLAGALVGVLLALIEFLPTLSWVVGGWLVVVGFMLLSQILYPRVIAPLFNDFEPVEQGDLREGVESVFERAGFEVSEIYTMDASRRSSRLNAYFVGFGRAKRVVLFDTLVEKLERPQIESVLAHELAHWKKGHIWKLIGASALQVGIVLAALGYLVSTEWVYDLFALPAEASYAGLFVSLLFVFPVLELSSPIVNRLSLAHEREADAFAVEVMGEGEPMVEALATLARENLANPFPHPWYAAFNHSHPPVPERMRYIEAHTPDQQAAPE
ncbi:peptidase M48 [Halobacteriales archaeon SW_10_66_29]|nr:MAG: peptidase M48 [Halobacteriales archaeon QH_6_66_25]PSQ35436.1 MAG: peptidase M48 [Halobacteriales archaeon SW_10_66_29]